MCLPVRDTHQRRARGELEQVGEQGMAELVIPRHAGDVSAVSQVERALLVLASMVRAGVYLPRAEAGHRQTVVVQFDQRAAQAE
jgi:hypothetical protein